MTETVQGDNVNLAPGVVDTIISIAVQEIDGVASLRSDVTGGFFSRIANKPSTFGIESSFNDNGKLDVDLHIEVEGGYAIPELADKVRHAVADALSAQARIEVNSVDIFIDGIRFEHN